jgi:hypothetical protein
MFDPSSDPVAMTQISQDPGDKEIRPTDYR